MEEFLLTIKYSKYTSDFYLFDDNFIKEIRFKKRSTETLIYELDKFIKKHPKHKIINKIKEWKMEL